MGMRQRMPKIFGPQAQVDLEVEQVHYPALHKQAAKYGGQVGLFYTGASGNWHDFNPTIIDYLGERRLIFRRSYVDLVTCRNMKTSMFWGELDSGMYFLNERQLPWPDRHPLENTDDPRASIINGKLNLGVCSFLIPQSMRNFVAHQSLGVFNGLEVESMIDVPYRKNHATMFTGGGMEKNWLWFEHDGGRYFVYQSQPHVVCRTEGQAVVEEFVTESELKWPYGPVRGGTPPVLVGDEYITFFHSSMSWREVYPFGMRNRYFMGALTFDAKPPFAIRRITKKPLLVGTHLEPFIKISPPVVFPGGAILDGPKWVIVYGVNDCRCGWLKMDHSELEKALSPCA